MKSGMTNRRRGMVVGLAILLGGCGSARQTAVNQREAKDWEAFARLDRQRRIEALVEEAMSAPAIEERTAAALMVAEHATGKLADAMRAVDTARDVLLNNIVNAETTAFKTSRPVFTDGKVATVQLDMTQGSMESTGRQLDVAIQGNGFFKLKLLDTIGDGWGYTRNGNFFVNNNGQLVLGMGDGYKLEPGVTIPAGTTDISIGTDGIVSVLQAGKTTKTTIGQLNLTQFVNAEGLSLLRGSIFLATDACGPPITGKPGEGGAGQVLQSFLEGSNVDLFRERLRMRFLQEWKASILHAVDGAEAKQKTAAAR